MTHERFCDILKSDYLKLLPILVLAAYIALIPHMDYPYPVHLDEWSHMAEAKRMMVLGDVNVAHELWRPLMADETPFFEVGFHLFTGIFQNVSGLSWVTITRYLPLVIFALTVLSAYIFGKRNGFGWEAALMTCLVPTTVGILGPGLLVPVALGLPLILLSIYLSFNFRTIWSYIVVFLFMSFLLSMHPVTAAGLAILLAPYILVNLRVDLRHGLCLAFSLGIPFVPVPVLFGIKKIAREIDVFAHDPASAYTAWPELIHDYGYIGTSLCLIGIFLLFIKGGWERNGLIYGFLLLLLILVTYIQFHFGLSILYSRGLLYIMLIMGIFAGCGLAGMRRLTLPHRLVAGVIPVFLRNSFGSVLCLTFVVATLIIAIPMRQDTYYYHMIDEVDYQTFVWIRDHLDESYNKAILDPWKATAFAAVTGRSVRSRIVAYPDLPVQEDQAFLDDGCVDTNYLRKRRVSIIYTRDLKCNNPDLVGTENPYVYLLENKGSGN